MEASSASVYGWRTFLNNSIVSAVSTLRPAYITTHAVGAARDHAHVVRDQDDPHPEVCA